jgi:hypothetical protein
MMSVDQRSRRTRQMMQEQIASEYSRFLLDAVERGFITFDEAESKIRVAAEKKAASVVEYTPEAPLVLQTVSSSSKPDVKYEIRQSRTDGKIYCTCPAWRFSKGEEKTCKHLEQWASTQNTDKWDGVDSCEKEW